MVTLGNTKERRVTGVSRGATQPFSRGRLTSPPPLCASDIGGLGLTKVKTRSDAAVASQSRLLRMLKSLRREELRRIGS